jgi:Family of unknown function (DUF6082)
VCVFRPRAPTAAAGKPAKTTSGSTRGWGLTVKRCLPLPNAHGIFALGAWPGLLTSLVTGRKSRPLRPQGTSLVYPIRMPTRFRFTARALSGIALATGLLALILVSPVLLRGLSHARNVNWQQLSDIGQTYDAAAAVLSGIALVGVAVSLVVQTRQAKTERIRLVRERQMELLQISMERPEVYGYALGADISSPSDVDQLRARLMFTLWMNYARMGYQMEVLTASALRADFFPNIFRSEIGRKWWINNRSNWLNTPVPDRRARDFSKLADIEYRNAVAAGPPVVVTKSARGNNTVLRNKAGFVTGVTGVAIGIAIRSIIARNSRRRRVD